MTFHIKTLEGGGPHFHVIATWSSCHKNLFSTIWYLCQNFVCHIVALIALACFRIVTHRYTASFSHKLILCETKNIFYSLGNCISDKMNAIFWNYIKNKGNVMSDSLETRLHNISGTTNARGFAKTILESSYKVLLCPCVLMVL